MNIVLKRDYNPEYTYGVWYNEGLPTGLVSIERPWLNNQNEISCIPAGIYRCTLYSSPTKGLVYLLNNVPNRDMIEIHRANFVSELKGCIGVGCGFGVLEGKPAVFNSSAALAKLMALTKNEEFTLTIEGDL